MSQNDWTEFSDGLGVGVLDKGVTTGIARPSGGGSFVYGFNSLDTGPGAAALFTNQVNFAPHAKGVQITGCVKRLPSGGNTGFSPFLIAMAQGSSVNDSAYLLGLADGSPYHIVLKKGTIVNGIADLAPDPSVNGILLRSTASHQIADDLWHHLRLDVITNDNGDVILQCFENDLVANPLGGAPSWVAIPGMEEFIDDTLGINSGSAPHTSGRSGFGMEISDVTRRAAVDHVECLRQL